MFGCNPLVNASDALEIQIHRIGVQRTFGSPRFGCYELGAQRICESRDDFILHVEQVGDRLVKALGPQVLAGFGVDQLHVHPKPVAAALHRAFEHVADVQFAPDLFHVDRLPLKVNAVLRAITNEPPMRDRSVVRLSVTPSTK